MIHGPDLGETILRAKELVQADFVRRAEEDGTQPTLRAMYVRKAEQAQLVLAGGSSPLIEGEAALRGLTPEKMAEVVIGMAAAGGDEVEIERIRVNLAVESAGSESEVVAILKSHGIAFTYGEAPPVGPATFA